MSIEANGTEPEILHLPERSRGARSSGARTRGAQASTSLGMAPRLRSGIRVKGDGLSPRPHWLRAAALAGGIALPAAAPAAHAQAAARSEERWAGEGWVSPGRPWQYPS